MTGMERAIGRQNHQVNGCMTGHKNCLRMPLCEWHVKTTKLRLPIHNWQVQGRRPPAVGEKCILANYFGQFAKS